METTPARSPHRGEVARGHAARSVPATGARGRMPIHGARAGSAAHTAPAEALPRRCCPLRLPALPFSAEYIRRPLPAPRTPGACTQRPQEPAARSPLLGALQTHRKSRGALPHPAPPKGT
ncbi:hypothetical protein NDU88_003847 [Pleurodeles waltl]|uniref:Uncharacterized protein n=1 Tax=Pleurodeles waltl TaxID=8319 RepID=A0AAV7V2Z1_PLEWA|nr:hypothetical protein NDU88_003847 [Pleurodeles waltl]